MLSINSKMHVAGSGSNFHEYVLHSNFIMDPKLGSEATTKRSDVILGNREKSKWAKSCMCQLWGRKLCIFNMLWAGTLSFWSLPAAVQAVCSECSPSVPSPVCETAGCFSAKAAVWSLGRSHWHKSYHRWSSSTSSLGHSQPVDGDPCRGHL